MGIKWKGRAVCRGVSEKGERAALRFAFPHRRERRWASCVGKVTDFFVMGGAKEAKARGENRGCCPTVYKKAARTGCEAVRAVEYIAPKGTLSKGSP